MRKCFNSHVVLSKHGYYEMNDLAFFSKLWRLKNKYPQGMLKRGVERKIIAESKRLEEDKSDPDKPWKMWGPYLSERQWGTVREDYSDDGNW